MLKPPKKFVLLTNDSPQIRDACALVLREIIFTGAVSGISNAAVNPSDRAPIQYHAGASGLPVRWISQVMTNCVEPPNTDIETA
jgi:hypothetical protein